MEKIQEELKINPMEATAVFVLPAFLIAGFELFLGASLYKPNMKLYELTGILDLNYSLIILLLYIIVLVTLFPLALCLFKKSGVELKKQFFTEGKKSKDILFGITAGVLSFAYGIIMNNVILKFPINKYENIHQLPVAIVSMVIVSGFCKEIYFRGIPYIFLKDTFGEWIAFLMGNICFMILDWPNVGFSFILGLIWYLFYRKRGALSIPIIAHGLTNLLYLLAGLGIFSFIGIIPK